MGHERGLECWGDAIDYAEKSQQKIYWALCNENESNAGRRNWLKHLTKCLKTHGRCGGLETCNPQPERGNICEPKSRESAYTGSLPSVVVVPKTERDTIQHGDVHDYMHCIKPIGEI